MEDSTTSHDDQPFPTGSHNTSIGGSDFLMMNTSQSRKSAAAAAAAGGGNFLFTKTSVTIKFVLFMVVFVLGTFGNGFVAYVIRKTPQLRSRANILLVGLITADLVAGFASTFLIAMYQFLAYVVADNPCQYTRLVAAATAIASVPIQAAIAVVVAIAFDRYIAIVYPFHYANLVTEFRAKIAVGVCWLVGLGHGTIGAVYAGLADFSVCKTISVLLLFIVNIITYVGVSLIMIIVYGRILKIALEHRSKIAIMQSMASNNHSEGAGHFKKELKAARTTAMVIGSYLILWLPYNIGRLIQGVGDTRPYSQTIVDIGLSIGLVNHGLNWIVYGISTKEFRNGAKQILKFADKEKSTSSNVLSA